MWFIARGVVVDAVCVGVFGLVGFLPKPGVISLAPQGEGIRS
jgi:hypothetical protein